MNSKIAMSGIAKGYIMEKTFSFLKESGLNNFIINAGGDVKLSGSKAGKYWTTSVLKPEANTISKLPVANDPKNSKYYAYCRSKNEGIGIATSASYYRFTEYKGKKYSHIIDTRTVRPTESDIISITVLYNDMSYADAYATAFYIQGYKRLNEQFDSLDKQGLGVIVVKQDQEKSMNKTAARYCRFAN